jgi:hypothetical protein
MTASRIPHEALSFTTPIIDCEPPPVGIGACPPPSLAALHRRTPRPSPYPSGGRYRQRPLRSVPREPLPPQAALVFADAALRRVLEVVDRRRPVAQLRQLIAPALIETVTVLTRTPQTATATLRRVRVRMVDNGSQAEVFATYTRARRVRAIAGRIEYVGERWRIAALQIG